MCRGASPGAPAPEIALPTSAPPRRVRAPLLRRPAPPEVSAPAARARPRALLTALALLPFSLVLAGCQHLGSSETPSSDYAAETAGQGAYLFGWPGFREPVVKLRGGTTAGVAVQLDETPSEAWTRLQTPGLSKRERDQAAIRALAGSFRTSFDFLETVVFGDTAASRQPATPYRSWATEQVFVLEDRPGFVSLQHVLVMFVVDETGVTRGPFVQKHWRQDWTYEPASIFAFRGFDRLETLRFTAQERAGRWSQAVYQVDDTPRFTLVGEWRHSQTDSTWTSGEEWRPLPRREHTIRSDYHVLRGPNRIVVQPSGWVHLQDNVKTVLTPSRTIDPDTPARAREIGVNRYDRIVDFDFSAGDAYWTATAGYWAAVREAWGRRLAEGSPLDVSPRCGEVPGFALHFQQAARIESGEDVPTPEEQRVAIEQTLDCLLGKSG